MAALQIRSGDEVISARLTWHSGYNAIVLAGAASRYSQQIGNESFNIDPTDIESKIIPQTKAIFWWRTAGSPADLDRFYQSRESTVFRVIETALRARVQAIRAGRSAP